MSVLDRFPFAAEHGTPDAGGGERLMADRGRWGDSSPIPTRQGRSERLADLAAATGSTHCLCGTGGLRYLDAGPFDAHGIPAPPFHTPVDDPLWQWARRSQQPVRLGSDGAWMSSTSLTWADAISLGWSGGRFAPPLTVVFRS